MGLHQTSYEIFTIIFTVWVPYHECKYDNISWFFQANACLFIILCEDSHRGLCECRWALITFRSGIEAFVRLKNLYLFWKEIWSLGTIKWVNGSSPNFLWHFYNNFTVWVPYHECDHDNISWYFQANACLFIILCEDSHRGLSECPWGL